MKILRMSTLTKAIYRFNVFNIKIPMKLFFFFAGIEKPILKFIQNLNESQRVKTENTEKGRINSSVFNVEIRTKLKE